MKDHMQKKTKKLKKQIVYPEMIIPTTEDINRAETEKVLDEKLLQQHTKTYSN